MEQLEEGTKTDQSEEGTVIDPTKEIEKSCTEETDATKETEGSSSAEEIKPQVEFFIPPIEDSFKLEKYQSVTERYFALRYVPNASGVEGEDQCVMFHSNKICIVTLAPHHPILAENKTITKVDYKVSAKVDRSKNTVSGKGKHGAQFLQPNSPLCHIDCSDGSRYTLSSCVQGKLVEVNLNLVSSPHLLVKMPLSDGYVGIVLPNINKSNKFKNELMTPEQYEKLRAKVKEETSATESAENLLELGSNVLETQAENNVSCSS